MALCGLLLCVGIGIGMNPDMKSDIKSLSPRLALLPLVTILGSWPPVEMGASGPAHLASRGVSSNVIISRMMLVSRAMVPSSAPRYSVMKMLERE